MANETTTVQDRLFPRPRRVVEHGRGAPRDTPIDAVQDSTLPPEHLVIDVDETSVRVRHADEAARRHAEATVGQLRALARDGRLPGCHIEDGPDVAVRGYMLDVSRDRVPTRETLDRLVGLLERARFNHLELYIEHTFAYADHEVVWRDASPLTPDDLAWLRQRCHAAGLELIANQNCLGHVARWLRHEPYRHRAESPDGYELVPGLPAPASTLAPTRENAEFVLALLRELLPEVDAGRVNIGLDEPFELGRGASAAAVAERGLADVYLDYLSWVAEPLVADGYEVLVWADVLRHHPGAAARLPAGVTPIAWNYEAPGGDPGALPASMVATLEQIGIDLDAHRDFATNVAPLVEDGVPFWVAPGTSTWCSLVGRLGNATANIVDAVETARAHRCAGLLLTDWGDDGHLQPPSVSFAPILYAGAVAWGLDANRDLDPAALLDQHAFEDPTGRLGAATVALGDQWARTGLRPFNASPLHHGVTGGFCLASGELDPDALRDVVDVIDGSLADLAAAEPAAPDGALVVDELTVAARLARHGALRLLGRTGQPTGTDLRADLAPLIEDQRRVWLARARPGGLDDAVAPLVRRLDR